MRGRVLARLPISVIETNSLSLHRPRPFQSQPISAESPSIFAAWLVLVQERNGRSLAGNANALHCHCTGMGITGHFESWTSRTRTDLQQSSKVLLVSMSRRRRGGCYLHYDLFHVRSGPLWRARAPLTFSVFSSKGHYTTIRKEGRKEGRIGREGRKKARAREKEQQ